jgi:hypothetical protein
MPTHFFGDANLRRDRRPRPQSTLLDGAVTADKPARTKPVPLGDDPASAWQREWRCALTGGRSYGLGRSKRRGDHNGMTVCLTD